MVGLPIEGLMAWAAPSLTRAEHHGCLVPPMFPALRYAVVLAVVAGFALTAAASRAGGSRYMPVTADSTGTSVFPRGHA